MSALSGELKASARLAFPLALAQLSLMAMGVVETWLAGRGGTHALAAVAVGAAVWSLALLALLGVLMAVPAFVGEAFGRGARERIAVIAVQAMWLGAALSIPLAAMLWTAGAWLPALGVHPTTAAGAGEFLRPLALAAPAAACFMVLRGTGEGIGLARPTLYAASGGALLMLPVGAIALDGIGNWPGWGLFGLGIAHTVVLWLQTLALAALLRRHHPRASWRPPRRSPSWAELSALLRVGLPMAVTVLLEGALFVAAGLLAGRLGPEAAAAHQIAQISASLAFMLPLGLAMASTVRVAQTWGAGDLDGVCRAAAAAVFFALCAQTLSALLLVLGAGAIATAFGGEGVVAATAVLLLKVAAAFQFSDGLQAVANGILRGLKDTRVPMLLCALAYWGLGMPLGYGLAFAAGWGILGLWFGLAVGLSAAAVLLGTRVWRRLRAMRHDFQQRSHAGPAVILREAS